MQLTYVNLITAHIEVGGMKFSCFSYNMQTGESEHTHLNLSDFVRMYPVRVTVLVNNDPVVKSLFPDYAFLTVTGRRTIQSLQDFILAMQDPPDVTLNHFEEFESSQLLCILVTDDHRNQYGFNVQTGQFREIELASYLFFLSRLFVRVNPLTAISIPVRYHQPRVSYLTNNLLHSLARSFKAGAEIPDLVDQEADAYIVYEGQGVETIPVNPGFFKLEEFSFAPQNDSGPIEADAVEAFISAVSNQGTVQFKNGKTITNLTI